MPRVSVLAKTPAIWGLIAGITVLGCHSYSPAKPDPPKAETTSIEGAADGVLVGGRAPLRVVVSSNAGTRPLENVVWSSDRPDIVDINSTGIAVGLKVGQGAITATSGGYKAISTLNVALDYSGVWKGRYQIVNCTRVSGDGSSYCRFVVGAILPIQLALTQRGGQVSGEMSLFDSDGRLLTKGAVSGTSDPDSALRISGLLRSGTTEQEESTEIRDWTTLLSATDASLTGTFNKRREFWNTFGRQLSVENCSVGGLSR